MQDPNEDTEWNDILRKKGILPPKEPDVTEQQVIQLVDEAIERQLRKAPGAEKALEDMELDELNDYEDDVTEEDEKAFEEYRRQRMAEMKAMSSKPQFGSVSEISGQDWVEAVNKAGEDIWVVVHLYKNGIQLCNVINHHLTEMAPRFPGTKFIKAVSTTCIPNYLDAHLPTLFIYCNGEMKEKIIGPEQFPSGKVTAEDIEWIVSRTGAIKSDMAENPRQPIRDVFSSSVY